MQTTNELKADIGKPGMCRFESVRVPVTVLDTRQVFGRTDYLVTVTGGTGQQWVSSDRVTVQTEEYNGN